MKFKSDYDARDAMERAQREVENAASKAREALAGYRRAANKVLNDPMIPAAGRAYRVGELRKEYGQKLLDLESGARSAVGAAAEAAAYLSRDQRSIAEKNRDDARMRLAFDRSRMLLDAGVSAAELVRRADANGDRETVEALDYFGETYMEAKIRGAGGNVNDQRPQFGALAEALEAAREKHPAEIVLSDVGSQADDVSLIATRARDEIEGGEPVVALHVDGGDFSETVEIARENRTLLHRVGVPSLNGQRAGSRDDAPDPRGDRVLYSTVEAAG